MKNSKIFSLLISCGIVLQSYSQTFQFAKSIGNKDDDMSNSIVTDINGNIYITGGFMGTSDFDPGSGTANLTANATDVFIAKYTAGGKYLWAKSMKGNSNSYANSIATDTDGNVYIAGLLSGEADFDPGVGTVNLSGGVEAIFFAKYDTHGNYLWAKSISSPSGLTFCNSIAVDANRNVYLAGTFQGDSMDFNSDAGTAYLYSDSICFFFAKYDVNGKYLWAKNIKNASNGSAANKTIAADKSGSIYITGSFGGTVDFNPGTGTSLLSDTASSLFLAKYDSNGNYLWAKNRNKNINCGFDIQYNLALDSKGNIYVTGCFFEKYDTTGKRLWKENGITGCIAINSNDKIITGTEDSFTLWDVSGKTLSGRLLTSPSFNNASKVRGIAADDAGNIYITGHFNDTVNFNTDSGTANLSPAGLWDIFFAKYSTASVVTSVKNNSLQSPVLTIYPNPAKDVVSFTYELTEPARISFDIYSLLGQKISIISEQQQPEGKHAVQWQTKDTKNNRLAAGIYSYKLQINDAIKTGLIVIE